MSFCSFLQTALVLSLHCRNGMAMMYDCAAESHAGCVANEPGSAVCVNAECVCDDNLFTSNGYDCEGKTCVLGTDVPTAADKCNDANSACSAADRCVCQANFETTRDPSDDSQSCAQRKCSVATATADCPGDNNYCDDTLAQSVCKCKVHFAAANLEACTKAECANSEACTGDAFCVKGTATGYGCHCIGTFRANATTGACIRKTCDASDTASNIQTVCGVNTYCKTGENAGCHCIATYSIDEVGVCQRALCSQSKTSTTAEIICGGSNTVCETEASTSKCFCKAGYFSVGTGVCTQTACTNDTVAIACGDATSYTCNSDNKCECATAFVASGSKCKKSCLSSSDCNINALCVNNICECNVNYQGNGVTCSSLPCTSTDVTTCHANSKCTGTKCVCADGYIADGAVCKKSCAADSGCATNGLCVSSKCECKANYVGDGANACTAVACVADTDCAEENSSCNTTSAACVCSDGYKASITSNACVKAETNPIACNFSSKAALFLLDLFSSKP